MRGKSFSPEAIQSIHGGLLLILLPLPTFIPHFTRWPWYLLAPLLGYATVVSLVSSLRNSIGWMRTGRFDGSVIALTATVMVVTSAVLILWDHLVHPDVSDLASQLPRWSGVHWLWACVVFATVNALLEEIVWRGIFMDALASQLGTWGAVFAQAILFGVAHEHGYPSGAIGVGLAALYGLLLGLIRQRSQGLAAPFLVHIGADATIYALVSGES